MLKRGFDLGRPDALFLLIWAGTTWLAYQDLYLMTFDRSTPITLLIGFNVVSFFVIYASMWRSFRSTPPTPPFDDEQSAALQRLALWLLVGWTVLFVVIVIRSGGIPLWWRIRHQPKSYVDFGVATLSGFANMLRSLILALCVLLAGRQRNPTALVIAALLIVSSVLEMARANTTYLLLCGLGVYLMRRRVSAKAIAALALAAVLFVLAFGWTEKNRSPGGSGGEAILKYPSILNGLPYGVTSVYLYLTTPVSNLYYAEARGIKPLWFPYFSTQLIVPTVVRDRIYVAHRYPIALRRDSYNATTFYSPFVADFGVAAAGLLVCLIQLAVSYVHVRGRRGDEFFQVIYGPLFAALVLSFFFNYFLTLGVLLFAPAALAVRWWLRSGARDAPPTTTARPRPPR